MDGTGVYKWRDGKQYEGSFDRDNKHGFGVFRWPDGRCYKGYWKKGKQHGLAIYMFRQDRVQVTKYGMWHDGLRQEWFDIDSERSVEAQLKAIEDRLAELQFSAPAQFYDCLA